MKTCPICGNAYSDDRSRCPFCLTEDRPDFKKVPLTSTAKKMLLRRFKWAEAKRKEYYFYTDWIDLDDERLINPFFTDRPTLFRLLRRLIKGTFSFLFSCITHFLSIFAYFTLYVFCSFPIYKLIAMGSTTKAEFTEIGLTYTAFLLIPSILAGTGHLTPLPIRLWNFIFHHKSWKAEKQWKKEEKEESKKILAYMFKIRAHCIEIRSEVCKKLPFLPESYWNEADLSFLQEALEKHQSENISLKDLMRIAQKDWGRLDYRISGRRNTKLLIDRIERKHLSDYLHPEQLEPGPLPKTATIVDVADEPFPEVIL